jgi:DNA adenine methylase
MVIRSPIKWHGGKSYLAKRIVNLMKPHTHYLEPYAGGLSVLFAKDPDGISETVNDINGDLSAFWRVIADPDLFGKFYRRVDAIPLSEAVFLEAEERLKCGKIEDLIERAVCFFIVARQSRQGLMRDYATPTRRTRRRMNENVSAWLSALDGLPEIADRLQRVEVRSMTAVEFIRKYDHGGALFYCDPPYPHDTRTARSAYRHEMSSSDHVKLLETLAEIDGKFLLSTYENEIYESCATRSGWDRCEFPIDNKASGRKDKPRMVEVVYANYPLND